MPFIRFNGWGMSDVRTLLENAGSAFSYGWANDNFDEPNDPVFKQTASSDEPDVVELAEEFYTKHAELKDGPKDYINHDVILSISNCMIATTIELAKYMTHKSVCIIFGRDMYPIQESIRVFGHKLRGTWIYVEGASRNVCSNEKFLKKLRDEFSKLFEKADVIYGVDTGYSGTVPERCLLENTFLSESIRRKVKVRLICHNTAPSKRRIFRSANLDRHRGFFRWALCNIESFAKPIRRTHEVGCDGLPVMRIADRMSVLASAILLNRVRDDSMRLLPYFNLYMDKSVDVAEEFFGENRQFSGKPAVEEAPAEKKNYYINNATHDEAIVMELFPDKFKPSCDCELCMNPWKAWMKEKLAELNPTK